MTSVTGRLVPVACAMALLAGCSTAPAPQEACPAYEDLKASVQQILSAPVPTGDVDALKAQADDLRTQADAVRDLLDRIQAVSDGQLDQSIATARQTVDEIRASLAVARYKGAETLAPQVAQAREDVRTAVAPVKNLLDSQCSTG